MEEIQEILLTDDSFDVKVLGFLRCASGVELGSTRVTVNSKINCADEIAPNGQYFSSLSAIYA